MDFLSSGLWWGLFIGASVSFIAYQLGRVGNGLWKKQLQGFGGLLAILFLILSFVFTGWKGGLSVLIGMTLVVIVGLLVIRLLIGGKPSE